MNDCYAHPAWRIVRLVVLERDNYVCQLCGGRAVAADHIVSLADGGAPFDPHNLRATCTTCNSVRSANRTNALKQERKRKATPSSIFA